MQTHTQACSKRKPPALAAGGLTTARFNEDQLEPLKSTLATWLKPDITRSSAVVVTARAHSLPGSIRLCRQKAWMTEVRTSVSSSLSGNVRTCISAPHNDPRHRILDRALRLVQLHILLLLGKAVIRNTRPSRQTAGSLRGLVWAKTSLVSRPAAKLSGPEYFTLTVPHHHGLRSYALHLWRRHMVAWSVVSSLAQFLSAIGQHLII